MECYFAKGTQSTDKTSKEYLYINNFGYYKEINKDTLTVREHGRLDYQIIYIDEGYGQFFINDRFVKAEKGNIIILHPSEKNIYRFYEEGNTSYYWIHFTGTGAKELLVKLKINGHIYKTNNFYEFKNTIESMKNACLTTDFTTDIFLSSSVNLLLTKISSNVYSVKSPIFKALEKMQNQNISEVNTDEYAKLCGLSKYHFIRTFKKITGVTPHQYISKLIIDKAIRILSTTNLNIAETAYTLGFKDNLYFSRFFKKHVGISPKKYIESLK